MVYHVDNSELAAALRNLRVLLPKHHLATDEVVVKCTRQRIDRISATDEAISRTVGLVDASQLHVVDPLCFQAEMVLNIATDSHTHWRYAIVAVRCLRTLIRRDAPLTGAHVEYLLGRTHDSNASMVRPMLQ